MTIYQVLNRHYRPATYADASKASVCAAMRAKATEHESVIAVHRNDGFVQLYRVQADGTVSRGQRIARPRLRRPRGHTLS